jgi:transcriptional antiterminator NusG
MAEAHWYVVHTYSGYENKVKANIDKTIENRHLEDQILEVRVPMQDVVELKNGANKTVSKKMFPGYVLINMVMNDDTWYVVRNTRGVTGFVGPASEPTPLSEEEVKALGVEINSVQVNFEVGDQVQVNGTAMDGFIGIVQKINIEDGTVDVLVSMFGRDTQATLALNQVRRLDD